MGKQITILVCLAMILTILACENNPDLPKSSEPQSAETQAIPKEEETSQPPIIPTLVPTIVPQPVPQNPYSMIQTTLRSYPPCTGNKELRNDAILELDAYLKDDSLNWKSDMVDFYRQMIGFVESEITEPVASGVRIWSMYNHGFLIKTPSTIIAFDLVNGYDPWHYQIPESILEQIDVLFISHGHEDHRDLGIIRKIKAFGGKVVVPVEGSQASEHEIPLGANEEVMVDSLKVKAYDGLHADIAVRMFFVKTPEGLTIMHTGDNQTSETLPDGLTVDILLLNAWVNESGSASAVVGIQNSIKKLSPELTILGHIQELGHYYAPDDAKSRLAFETALSADNELLPGYVSVQIWGEHCNYPLE